MIRLEMKNGNTIWMKNHKNSVFSLGNIGKYQYISIERILPSDQIRMKSLPNLL